MSNVIIERCNSKCVHNELFPDRDYVQRLQGASYEFVDFKNPILDEVEFESFIKNPPYKLNLTIDELIGTSSKSRVYKKFLSGGRSKPPRPPNSFVIFRKNFVAGVNSRTKAPKMSKIVAEAWESQPPAVRKFFNMLAERAKVMHNEKFPNYKYTPRRSKKIKEKNAPAGESKDICDDYLNYEYCDEETMSQYNDPVAGVPVVGNDIDEDPVAGNDNYEFPTFGNYSVPISENWLDLSSFDFDSFSNNFF
ncbi:14539_t:CDS:2 [Acaulospora morrowiae]|uniref:14539_t:CDS:1 n=1 Tax=Acaulospora morrowiae TaxID=94023 RepID=A0A9N9C6V7_9GLOM|nr:14539_t:CDS:2 [Acaulospora morrowiae]